MASSTRENSSMTRGKAMESSLGGMVVSTRANGATASSMEKALL